jgi:hypothetical protein
MPTADFTVRQSQWRILLSALAGGGLRHVSPVGASTRPEMSINFSGGHFQQFDWAEVYICKKIANESEARCMFFARTYWRSLIGEQ